jgi:hypothetical protein
VVFSSGEKTEPPLIAVQLQTPVAGANSVASSQPPESALRSFLLSSGGGWGSLGAACERGLGVSSGEMRNLRRGGGRMMGGADWCAVGAKGGSRRGRRERGHDSAMVYTKYLIVVGIEICFHVLLDK